MRYISTRGAAPPVDFTHALIAGLAPDGGLYVPEAWPTLTKDEIAAFAGQDYSAVAGDILSLFVGSCLTRTEVSDIVCNAYGGFRHRAKTPLRQLDSNLWLLELFHGPTLAFKDVAMQLLARLYDHVLEKQKRTLTIVCATSGDTGGAAVEAFGRSKWVKLVVLFPKGRISDVQRRFMTTTGATNVKCVAVKGTFDDCQAIVKGLFADKAFAGEVDLSGVNSINWARIVAQSVYYFTSAVALGAPNRKISFAVPTGNFGDAFAGYVAHKMGLPIKRIVVGTNANDIVARAIETGCYTGGAVVATQSPAMDIQVASNFERLYFEVTGRDDAETAGAFGAFAKTGVIDIPSGAHKTIRTLFSGVSVSEDLTAKTIRTIHSTTGIVIDPHTAVGVSAAMESGSSAPIIVLSTAHPAKFPEAVQAATGFVPTLDPRHAGIMSASEQIDHLSADAEAVNAYVRAFAGRRGVA